MPGSPLPPPLPDEQPPLPPQANAEAGPSRQRTSSPSPPPLPDEKPPLPPPPRRAAVEDGSDDDESQPPLPAEEEPTWDPAAQTSLQGVKAAVEKPVSDATHGWQAVWAPQQNAYYFWNSRTNETTWINPLAPPPPPAAAPAPAPSSSLPPLDPELTHLLPRESRPDASASAGPGFVSAEFNARTGRFTPANFAYRVDHLAEANRARRQEAAFFDVDEWDKEREKEWAEKRAAGDDGDRPKKITKADMERFRAKKMEKKMRNNAWLRE